MGWVLLLLLPVCRLWLSLLLPLLCLGCNLRRLATVDVMHLVLSLACKHQSSSGTCHASAHISTCSTQHATYTTYLYGWLVVARCSVRAVVQCMQRRLLCHLQLTRHPGLQLQANVSIYLLSGSSSTTTKPDPSTSSSSSSNSFPGDLLLQFLSNVM